MRSFSLLSLCAFSLLVGCTSSPGTAPEPEPSQQDGPRPGDVVPADAPAADAAPAAAAATEGEGAAPGLDEATLAGLASADAMDGTADHVVSKCAGCKLMMDGKEEHSVAVGDHALHFCSTTCRDHFVGDLPVGLTGLLAAAAPASDSAAEKPAAEKPAAGADHGGHDHGAH